MIRIGHGFDVHAFTSGDFLMIGGVKVPYSKSFLAHSDGDVLIHAVCDAILGALALGDIGKHFPDTDPKYQNINSRMLLQLVMEQVKIKGYLLNNLDATVIAEEPKLRPYIDLMRQNLAADCLVEIDAINVKATTTEKLGFTGRQEGVAVHAVCSLLKIK